MTILSLIFLLVSCGDIENEYCSRRAYLQFNNQNHLNPALAPALTGSTNIFCRIYLSNSNQLTFQNNQGMKETSTLNEWEMQSPIILGIKNSTGVIVGYGFDNVFYCYDACCPNCYDNGKMIQVLDMQSSGIATCSRCKRSYSLSNNGLSPEGGRLDRYYAVANGVAGVLKIDNH